MSALTALRDQGTQTVLAGKAQPELFHDVISINDTLAEEDQSLKLFKTLDKTQPDFAKRCFHFMEDALISASEVDLFTR